MSRDFFLFFLLLCPCPGTGNSGLDRWKVSVACFVTDNPSLLEMACELTTNDRILLYYDSTTPSVQFLVSGFEDYRGIFEELVQDRDRALISLRRTMALTAAVTNHSSPPNEIAQLFLYPEKDVVYGQESILICLVSGLFPPTIDITLQKNGAPLDAHVNSSKLSFGEDWRFQVLHYAQVRPEAGDTYSCKALHTISREEKIVYWDGIKELGQEEVTYYTERARGFNTRLQTITEEIIKLTNAKSIIHKKPVVHIYTKENYTPRESNTLFCYAEKFYPFEIDITLLINGKSFTGPVNSSQLMVETDWTFNILKYIRIDPQDGDTYSCQVDHMSLDKPLTVLLDQPPAQPHSGTIVCAVGVIAGVLGLLIGLYLVTKIHNRQGKPCSRPFCKE
ncbi:rano class II histocompatibility antigen, A beta chain-like isoform X3 [Carcharodon carcharias]|uniref:rano class II histocompatibility antigen, A beta chain-like isoform X3 n=1 Tax=Carcharodon carcharias TaxID=13397 RepID=UPI001B7F0D48|nr:rano class II histocompatibility antigen, A beta chain-like isoform X3 [Carcharodon carcharias]